MQNFKLILLLVSIVFSSVCCNKQKKNEAKPSKIKIETQAKTKNTKDSFSSLEEKLVDQGVNFYARGHEPSWSLNMGFERYYVFTTMNGDKIIVPAVEGEKAMDANVTRFYAEVELGKLDITLIKQECEDSMTGELFDYKVDVRFKYGIDDDLKNLRAVVNTYQI